MSEKTSQGTQEEMLNQTFGSYDAEMTATAENPETVDEQIKTAEKKKSSNKLFYLLGGAATIGVLGYLFLPALLSEPQPVQQQVAPVQSPVVQAPVVAPVPATAPTENFLANQTTNQNPMAGERVNEDLTRAVIVPQAPVQAPVAQAIQPPVITPPPTYTAPTVTPVAPVVTAAPVVAPSAGNNAVQQELVSQLQQMFEKQTQEIKTSISTVDNRVSDLEQEVKKSVAEQKTVNASIEDRLAKLETGKTTKVAVVEKPAAKPVAAKPVKVASAPKRTVRPATVPTRKERAGSNILVDKSEVVTAPRAPDIKIHSIFSGRVWTRNPDGSLSTFSAGERLPNGETIRSVGEDRIITSSGKVIR